MTKIEYIKSLVATGLTSKEISAKTKIWAAENETQEVKTDDTQNTDATVVSTTNEASNGASSDGASDYQSVAKPAETYSPGDGNDYKYEVDEDGKPTYYQKTSNSDSWVVSSVGSTDELRIASQFKHAEFSVDDAASTSTAFEETQKAIDAANQIGTGTSEQAAETREARTQALIEKQKIIDENPDFYKILSWELSNYKFIDDILESTNKKIHISTGTSSIKELDEFHKRYGFNSRINFIHTQLSQEPKDTNLKAITFLKDRFPYNIDYGNHCNNKSVILASVAFQPSNIWLYVKGGDFNFRFHPDEFWAINLSNLDLLINDIKAVELSIGDGLKKSTNTKGY